ncbi:MAG TPA: VWA domain-containing protein, partial [Natronoarchaeum rubrum]|nr:VWA domain-containing protein [Natronoarchaeum rubrum]
EVNLLDDHLVDVLLDAAAGGVNRVERDGVSVAHPAEFTLIGTMNPEEGDLRPQLRDRFALQVSVTGSDDLAERVAIIDRALGENADEDENETTSRHRDRLLDARERLPGVALPAEFKRRIAELCRDAGVEGHRADVATARAARALAALDDRPRVLESDVRRAAELALPHRLQSRPFEDAPDPEDVLDDQFEDAENGDGREADAGSGEDGSDESDREDGADDETAESGDAEASPDEGADSADAEPERSDDGANGDDEPGPAGSDDRGRGGSEVGASPDSDESGSSAGGDAGAESSEKSGDRSGDDDPDDADETATPLLPGQERAGIGDARAPSVDAEAEPGEPQASESAGGAGSRRGVASASGEGTQIRTERASAEDAVDAAASVRAAAARGADAVESRDLRRSVRSASESALVVFALDASASMRGPMRAAKGVVMELLRDAYEQRDEVAVVAFAGEDADVLLPPTDSVSAAARHLKELPTADRTPLPAGLDAAADVLERADPAVGVVVLVTDGRANAVGESPTAATREAARRLAERGDRAVVVDAGDLSDRSALTADVARICGGDRVPLDDLTPERVEDAVARGYHHD